MSIMVIALPLVALVEGAIAAPRDKGSRINLYREKVEIYWNNWTGLKVSGTKGGQVDIHVKGEGKTTEFDGILSINCSNRTGYIWKTAADFAKSLSDERAREVVPQKVIANARRTFC